MKPIITVLLALTLLAGCASAPARRQSPRSSLGGYAMGCEIDPGYTAVCLQRAVDMGLAPKLLSGDAKV